MKVLLIIFGCTAFVLGVAGAFLPVLPTTPFMLVSAVCFAKSSARLHAKLVQTKVYQKYASPVVENRAMPLRRKLVVVIPVSIILLTVFCLTQNTALRIIILSAAVIKYWAFFFWLKSG